jgi:hypothetical protein
LHRVHLRKSDSFSDNQLIYKTFTKLETVEQHNKNPSLNGLLISFSLQALAQVPAANFKKSTFVTSVIYFDMKGLYERL